MYVLFVMENWPGRLVVRKCFMYYNDPFGWVKWELYLHENCMFGMVNPFYISVTLYFVTLFAISYPEILINPRIFTVYLWISLGYIVKSHGFQLNL